MDVAGRVTRDSAEGQGRCAELLPVRGRGEEGDGGGGEAE